MDDDKNNNKGDKQKDELQTSGDVTTEDKKNDQSTAKQRLLDKTQPKLREIPKEELNQTLEEHKKWLESDGKEGEKANLNDANLKETDLCGAKLQYASLFATNLQKADLRETNLQEAQLYKINLQEANLFRANLQKAKLNVANMKGAYLFEANLQDANLYKADMRNTVLDSIVGLNEAENLKYANLDGATGLLGNEFAQADLTGTKLPKNIEDFKALETVKETSQNARKIFFAMLLGCVYSWLTIATTTDVRLLTNTASSPLPIIGTEIPIAGFYFTAPLVLICLYFYFHLYLDKLWKGLSSLPAIFPDGKRLEERVYPWLLNDLVCRHFKRLKKRPLISHMKEWITIFLAWWVVPITMIYFWLRFIPRHDWVGTIFHIGLIVLSVAFSIIFYRLCALTLQGKRQNRFRILKFWGDRRFYNGASIVLVGVLFSLLSYGAIEGVRPHTELKKNHSIKELVPWIFLKLKYDVFADFREKDVSEKPANYGQIAKEERLEFVKGANLKGADLRNADMNQAFLVKADLRKSLLNGANLSYAQLQGAKLQGANLLQALLKGANLLQSSFKGANLQQTDLSYAQLQQVNLEGAYLHHAKITHAQLQQANLSFGILSNAYLFFADLQQANLMFAQLQHSVLTLANLQESDLSNVDLQEANIDQADLRGANLTGARHITIEQLSKVKTLYQAKLDPELLEQVKECCPQLLEKPKEETNKAK